MSSGRFRYSLEALLRKRKSDWKIVKTEEVTASRVVDDRSGEVDRARGGIEETEHLLRQARRGGAPIDPTQQHLLGGYLAHQRATLEQRQQALHRAREVWERVRSNLEGISRNIKSLERHRAGREADHRLAQSSLEQKNLDELWLLVRGKKGETG